MAPKGTFLNTGPRTFSEGSALMHDFKISILNRAVLYGHGRREGSLKRIKLDSNFHKSLSYVLHR